MQNFYTVYFPIKKVTVLIVLLLLLNSLQAQDIKKFRFGLNVAPSISWFKPDAAGFESHNPALKFSYGLLIERMLSDNYSFATGLNITTMGGSVNFPDSSFYTIESPMDTFRISRRTYNLQFVDIPLTLKMRTNEIGYLRYFGQFGFNISVRTKAKATDRAGGFERPNLDIADDIQLFRLALNLGMGIEYNLMGNTGLIVSATYSNGFTNILKKESVNVYGTNNKLLSQKATLNYVALNIGILF